MLLLWVDQKKKRRRKQNRTGEKRKSKNEKPFGNLFELLRNHSMTCASFIGIVLWCVVLFFLDVVFVTLLILVYLANTLTLARCSIWTQCAVNYKWMINCANTKASTTSLGSNCERCGLCSTWAGVRPWVLGIGLGLGQGLLIGIWVMSFLFLSIQYIWYSSYICVKLFLFFLQLPNNCCPHTLYTLHTT